MKSEKVTLHIPKNDWHMLCSQHSLMSRRYVYIDNVLFKL